MAIFADEQQTVTAQLQPTADCAATWRQIINIATHIHKQITLYHNYNTQH